MAFRLVDGGNFKHVLSIEYSVNVTKMVHKFDRKVRAYKWPMADMGRELQKKRNMKENS